MKDKIVDKKIKQKLNYTRKNQPAKTAKHNEQKKTIVGRINYSKTDMDATFMHIKEDHMK